MRLSFQPTPPRCGFDSVRKRQSESLAFMIQSTEHKHTGIQKPTYIVVIDADAVSKRSRTADFVRVATAALVAFGVGPLLAVDAGIVSIEFVIAPCFPLVVMFTDSKDGGMAYSTGRRPFRRTSSSRARGIDTWRRSCRGRWGCTCCSMPLHRYPWACSP